MADKLSWDEIKRRYPDEFVVIVDAEFDGVVVAGESAILVMGEGRSGKHRI